MSRPMLQMGGRCWLTTTRPRQCWQDRNGWQGSPRVPSQQGVSELWQLLVRLQPPKALAGLHHAGGRPAQGHRDIAPALHIPGDLADRGASSVAGCTPQWGFYDPNMQVIP